MVAEDTCLLNEKIVKDARRVERAVGDKVSHGSDSMNIG